MSNQMVTLSNGSIKRLLTPSTNDSEASSFLPLVSVVYDEKMNCLFLVAFAVIPVAVFCQETCPNPMYKRFSVDHTGCKSRNPSCSITAVSQLIMINKISNLVDRRLD